jgi:DNA (cytosine-5)-methyltransferase 1
MTRPRLLDAFCCQGGASWGYWLAGFDVTGIDQAPQPRYPFKFVQGDALTYPLDGFDALHASPPCQDHSETRLVSGDHGTGWMLAATLDRFQASGLPWVVENVDGAPLARQADLFGAEGLELCGCMFPELRGLIYENRLFQTSFPVPQPSHVKHLWPQTKMGRKPKPGECMQVTGHFSGVEEAQRRMGAPWMTGDGLAQAIPPAYAKYVGEHLLRQVA